MQPIGPVSNIGVPAAAPGSSAASAPAGVSFKEFLADSIQDVNAMQARADQAIGQLGAGAEVSTAEVMTAVQKADLAFRRLMQIRNQFVQAYDEVKNMRV